MKRKLFITIIEPTHPGYTKKYDAYYNRESGHFTAGMFYYYYNSNTNSPEIIKQNQITRYQIDLVKQKKKRYMFTTLLHELCHYIVTRFFHDNKKLDNFIDKYILTK